MKKPEFRLPSAVKQSIYKLHQHYPQRFVIVVNGAGASLLTMLAHVQGTSKTLIEGAMPTSHEALDDFLGEVPQEYASDETALMMARRARVRACELNAKRTERTKGDRNRFCIPDTDLFGLGLIAVIEDGRPGSGGCRIHCAVAEEFKCHIATIRLARNDGRSIYLNRQESELLAGMIGLNMLLMVAGMEQVRFDSTGTSSPDYKVIEPNEAILHPRVQGPPVSAGDHI